MIKKLLPILFLLITVNCYAGTTQLMVGGHDQDLDAAATEYFPISGSDRSVFGTRSRRDGMMPISGTFQNFRMQIYLDPDNGAGTQSYAFTLEVNSVNTAITCTISDGSTSCTDLSNTVTVAQDDIVNFEVVPTNTPIATSNGIYYSIEFVPDTTNQVAFIGGADGSQLSASAVESLCPHSTCDRDADVASGDKVFIFPTAGTLSGLRVKLDTAPANGAGTQTRTFAIGAVDCTISEAETTCNSASDTETVTAGEELMFITTPSGTPALALADWGMVFTPTTEGEFPIMINSDNGGAFNTTGITYLQPVGGDSDPTATEGPQSQLATAMEIRNIYARVQADPGTASDTWDFTLRDDGGSTALTCQVTGTSPFTCDHTTTVTIATPSLLSTMIVPANTPNTPDDVSISYTGYIEPTGSTRRRVSVF